MIRTRALTSILAATLMVGCAAKKETTLTPPPPEPNPEPQLATDARQRAEHLGTLAEQYAAGAAKLPGANEQADRQQVADEFGLLAQILPLLNGPDMAGGFRQQMRIIESSRSQLTSGSMDLASEPTIDTGLRAAQRALSSLAGRQFAQQAEVAKHVDAMRAAVQELDTVSGPIHRHVAGQAFQHSAQAVQAMTAALNQRFAETGTTNKTATPAQPNPAQPEQPATPAQPVTPAQPTPPTPQPEQPKAETPKPAEQPKPEQPKPEQPKPAQPTPPPVELNK